MVLLEPVDSAPLGSGPQLLTRVAGAELNVCVAAARFGFTAALCSRVGDDPLGRFMTRCITELGVNADPMVIDPAGRTTWVDALDGAASAVDDAQAAVVAQAQVAVARSAAGAHHDHRQTASRPETRQASTRTAILDEACHEPATKRLAGVLRRRLRRLVSAKCLVRGWSRVSESNRRPAVYKTAALPAELTRR